MRAQKLFKKAAKAGLSKPRTVSTKASQKAVAEQLCVLAELCQQRGWSAEEMLQKALRQRERTWRRDEARLARAKKG
jgi:hypothetical protein